MASIRLGNPAAEIFVPDGTGFEAALGRTTHLGIGAHQDDLEFMAFHGIGECFENEVRFFCGIVLTNGSGSPRSGPYAGKSGAEISEIRRAEQRHAASIGKYGLLIQLGYPSEKIKDPLDPAPLNDLVQILSMARPEVAYIHNPADKHPTHLAAFALGLRALRSLPPAARPGLLVGCEVWRGLDWLPDTEKIRMDSGGKQALAAALISAFDSQITGGKRYDLAVPGRRRANATLSDPHSTDSAGETILGMDLTPLIADDSTDPVEFTCAMVRRFETEVRQGLETALNSSSKPRPGAGEGQLPER